MEHCKARSARHKAHRGSKSGCKSRKVKERTKEGVSAVARKKPCSSPSRVPIPMVTSQEQAKKH